MAWVTVALVVVLAGLWASIGSPWHWILLMLFVYSVIATPFTLAYVLRLHWNAPEAERANRARLP